MVLKIMAIAVLMALSLMASSLPNVASQSSAASGTYPLKLAEVENLEVCPSGNFCASVVIVNQSPGIVEGVLYGNATGHGVEGSYVYKGNTTVIIPPGQNLTASLVFAPRGTEPGLCQLKFGFVVFATNGTQLSDLFPGVGDCMLSNQSLAASNPACTRLGYMEAASVVYTNHAAYDLYPLVVGVVKDSAGQTIFYTTAMIGMAMNGSSTAYLAIPDLGGRAHSETIFAMTLSGIGIGPALTLHCP